MKNVEPAFPVENEYESFNGMTLRDYFAAKAMLCFAIPAMYGIVEQTTENGDNTVAKRAYELAYAMLNAREEQICKSQKSS